MAVAAPRLLTASEFRLAFPRVDYAELVDGQIVVNFPSDRHQKLQLRLLMALAIWCEGVPERGEVYGTVGVQAAERDNYGPDVNWFSPARVEARQSEDPYGLPSLCVEIRSPSTWRFDTGIKRQRLESAGLSELWLVDDEARMIRVLRRSRPDAERFDVDEVLRVDDTLTSPRLPGFALALSTLFAR